MTSSFRLSLVLLFTLALVLPIAWPSRASALGGGDFRAGRIIDDSVFFNGNNMSAAEIQSFLNSKVPVCDTNHARSSSPNDPGPPYTCLKGYQQSISGRAADAYCTGSVSGGTKSAAQIIKDVATACSISPKVILVTLQKEQSLITDTWPWPIQYEKATGYACPDTAPCDPEFAGFFNQVWYGARQFQRYAKLPGSYSYKMGQSNYIQYNPNAGCGGTNVFIQNQATAGLYNYTPYQPNAAALNNLYGTGDGCSAYGNRNFWRLFNDWFGASTSDSDVDTLTFIRLNHGSGNVEGVGYSSLGNYSYMSRYALSNYPAVATDGSVVPLQRPNGDLSLVRLNHSSGNVEVVSYSAEGGYKQMTSHEITAYPAVAPDGAVVSLYRPNGDLCFARLNHGSGNVEVVCYSGQSGYKQMTSHEITAYPAVAPDGAVVSLFRPNGDLTFVRLNHSSGNVEHISYSGQSGYKRITSFEITGYPAVAPDGAVVPLYKSNGNLAFVRLNHSSGNVEVVAYSGQSGYKAITILKTTGYPAVAADGAVVPLFAR